MSFLVLVSFTWDTILVDIRWLLGRGGEGGGVQRSSEYFFCGLRTMVVKHGVAWGPEMRWWEILDWGVFFSIDAYDSAICFFF